KLFDRPGICPDPSCNMELLHAEGEFLESRQRFMEKFFRAEWIGRVYGTLVLPAIIQGIILSLMLVFRGGANRWPSYFLATLIIALSLQNIKFYYVLNVLVQYVSNTGGNPEYNLRSLSFPLSGVLFIGPALFLYVRSLTSEFKFGLRDALHFSPGILFIIINSVVFFGIAAQNPPAHAALVKFFSIVSSVENALAIGLSFYYIFSSIRLIKRHELWVYQHFSTTSRKSLNWLRNLVIALSIVWLVWLFSTVINFFTRDFILTYLSSYPFQVVTSILIFWVGYVGFIQSEVFSVEISMERKMDDLKSTAKKETETNQEIQNALIKGMENDKLFLVPDLTLAMLGQQLNLSPKSISQTLNNDLDKNFHDFINEYRVEEVKKRLLDPAHDHLTILAIALDSGFNSKSSFNRIFMKNTGMSPKEFKEKQRVAVS
ncbi:MAG: helix-turn-helix domain-containing protein, partial [Bacteroidota bacterium]